MVIGGKTGWIGQQLVELLNEQGIENVCCNTRMENRETLSAELDEVPSLFALGTQARSGETHSRAQRWGCHRTTKCGLVVSSHLCVHYEPQFRCEANKQATVRGNVIGMLNVADLCESKVESSFRYLLSV